MHLYIHAQKIQEDNSASGLRDGVYAVCIVWVVVWVGWRGEDADLGCESASTCPTSEGPLRYIC